MGNRNTLLKLSELIKERNAIDAKIAEITGRPAHTGHIGEFVASKIFGIRLHDSASHRGSDGYFAEDWLIGQSVNIKYYSNDYGSLDININSPPDFYLVLTGPKITPSSSAGRTTPWVISSVFLFKHSELVQRLKSRGVKVGNDSSVRRDDWDKAEIYPRQSNARLRLSHSQIDLISKFGDIDIL